MARHDLIEQLILDEKTQTVLDAMNKPVGSMDFDAWGFNRGTNRAAIAAFRWLYEKYFRVITRGLDNIPSEGRCLVIANHSGQLPFDAALLGYALATNPHGPRAPRAMMERFLPTVPFVGNFLNEIGAVVGDPVNCERMLESEEVILVFPEGVRGTGKPIQKRYQLQRFGHGFMYLAVATNTPIVPVGIVGCEETMPTIGHSKLLARLTGLPYVPIAPPVVLPTRVRIHVGEPMHFSAREGTSEEVMQQVEEVKDAIRGLLDRGLAERKGIFS